MKSHYLFPTPLWVDYPEQIDNNQLKDLCFSLYKEDSQGRIKSNQGGWQSQAFSSNTYTQLKDLENIILKNCFIAYKEYGYTAKGLDLYLTELWFNINKKGNSNSVHIHPGGFLSGVYYVEGNADQGGITFHRNYSEDYAIASQGAIGFDTSINASVISVEPETGKLMLFPSYLPHGVESNPTDKDRISISFNVVIR